MLSVMVDEFDVVDAVLVLASVEDEVLVAVEVVAAVLALVMIIQPFKPGGWSSDIFPHTIFMGEGGRIFTCFFSPRQGNAAFYTLAKRKNEECCLLH